MYGFPGLLAQRRSACRDAWLSATPPSPMVLEGRLVRYAPGAAQRVAFISPLRRSSSTAPPLACVALGGLTDGLLAAPWVSPLAEALPTHCQLVQPLLRSSYGGYGVCTLDDDVADLDLLVAYLMDAERFAGVALLGHSTGCQDAVHFVKTGERRGAVRAVVLQAPVSDREYAATLGGEAHEALARATKMVQEGRGDELMRRRDNYDGTPITAHRLHSLGAKGGQDDLFSSDFSEDERRALLGHLRGTPTLVLTSGADEYVPKHIDKASLTANIAHACGGEGEIVEGADHACGGDATGDAVRHMVAFIERVDYK